MDFRILVAEDDENIVKLIKLYLENSGFEVLWACDGVAALQIFAHEHIDLAIVDIMMPKMNGYELIKSVRAKNNLPIIILSAAVLDSDIILGLDMGADDYLVKPFNPLELVARVNANLRRFYKLNNTASIAALSHKIQLGELTIDTQMLTTEKCGKQILLTATEYKILVMLMKSPGRVFTKAQIGEQVNGEYFSGDDSAVMVHISNLREKIEHDPKSPEYIKTVRGLGYKIEKIDN